MTRPTLFNYARTVEEQDACAAALFAVIAVGVVKIEARHRFPLREAADAHRALESRATTGSILLVP